MCPPDTFRCKCQRDCWLGDPDDYDTCLAACDPDCGFPEIPGLPSTGYQCPTPVPAYTAAIAACSATYTTDDAACTGGGSGECACHNDAYIALKTCEYDAALAALPDWLACLDTEIGDDETCCDSDLGDCYAAADRAYLTAITPFEEDYFECLKGCYSAGHLFYSYITSPVFLGCVTDFRTGCPDNCRGLRYLAEADARKERRIARARCEATEIRRRDTDDRKLPGCAGIHPDDPETVIEGTDYHIGLESCQAEWARANDVCDATLWSCQSFCDPFSELYGDCLQACYPAYTACWRPAYLTTRECLMDCCTTQHWGAQNDHGYAQCYFDCETTYLLAKWDCESGAPAEAATCLAAALITNELCRGECLTHPRDCPNCFDVTTPDDEEHYYYYYP